MIGDGKGKGEKREKGPRARKGREEGEREGKGEDRVRVTERGRERGGLQICLSIFLPPSLFLSRSLSFPYPPPPDG